MKCPKCQKEMLVRSKDISYNFAVKPRKKYSRSLYWCENDDVWINEEIPSKTKKYIHTKIKIGIYQHYKGVKVRVIGVGLHSETLEELVLYEKLADFRGYKKGSLWARPKEMFLEKVTVNNKKIPRFKFIRE